MKRVCEHQAVAFTASGKEWVCGLDGRSCGPIDCRLRRAPQSLCDTCGYDKRMGCGGASDGVVDCGLYEA